MSEAQQPPKHHLGHRLAGWVDDELPPGTRQLVAAHLAMCSTCRVAAVIESRTKADLRDLGGPAPSNDLMASLLGLPGVTPSPPSAANPPSTPSAPCAGAGFTAAAPRRRGFGPGPLLAASVASVAALTVASAWLTAEPTTPGNPGVRQAGGGVDANVLGAIPTDLPDGGPQTSFSSTASGVAYFETLRLR